MAEAFDGIIFISGTLDDPRITVVPSLSDPLCSRSGCCQRQRSWFVFLLELC